ncbi:MAG TPA: 4-hydroxy-tetrahydrodipicolinate reductase [Rhizomicrobium sp.]|jgi:4-hydroxy-tetrahydrodipicolinate reductase|nr:4-hydroxy-tetrahydrodipicolinate reductase [Rhizomicrobium sp.]
MNDVRMVIAGAAGRMGRSLVHAVLEDNECSLAGALEAPGHPHCGADAAIVAGAKAAGVIISHDARAVLAEANALVDFTVPAVSVGLAALSAEMGIVHIMGTTGFSSEDEGQISAAAGKTVIVKSGNMSMGVTLLAALVRQAARALPDFDVEILEMHHRMKVDAPSGTALLLGRAAAEGRGEALEAETLRAGRQRQKGSVGFASLRGGTVVGEHHVILAGAQERIILGHVAEDRTIFARGAIAAAKWGQSREPGLYGMADVLGIAEERC